MRATARETGSGAFRKAGNYPAPGMCGYPNRHRSGCPSRQANRVPAEILARGFEIVRARCVSSLPAHARAHRARWRRRNSAIVRCRIQRMLPIEHRTVIQIALFVALAEIHNWRRADLNVETKCANCVEGGDRGRPHVLETDTGAEGGLRRS